MIRPGPEKHGVWPNLSLDNALLILGAKGFAETTEKLMYSIALVNSSSAKRFLKFLAPTLDFKVGDVAKLPNPKQRVTAIAAIAEECVAMAKSDYDAFEESWDFSKHPLI